MTRLAIVIAHEAMRRAMYALGTQSSIPRGARLRFHLGQWCTMPDFGRKDRAVFLSPEEKEYVTRIERGPVLTYALDYDPEGPGDVIVMFTNREYVGERARATAEAYEAWLNAPYPTEAL